MSTQNMIKRICKKIFIIYQLPFILTALVHADLILVNVGYLTACVFISHDDVALFE